MNDMKYYLKACVTFITLLACLGSLSGCFDRRELDTICIVLGVAIDAAQEPGNIDLTIQMANPSGSSGSDAKEKTKTSKSSAESSGSSSEFINISQSGHQVNYIIREMQHKMSRKIYVAHSENIIFGEELAKIGVRDCLDFFNRAPEARLTLKVFVARGKASEVYETIPTFEKSPSAELSKTLQKQEITSHVPVVTEFEFIRAMVSKTTAPVAPIVSIIEENDQKKLFIDGCAVFKESRMVGEMNDTQTRGLLFITNKVKTAVLETMVLDATVTTEIRSSKSSVTPILYTDGTVVMNVNVTTTVGLGDQSGTVNITDTENLPAFLQAAEETIKEEIYNAVDQSKSLNADVFGFGEAIGRKYPDEWKDMKDQWDALYQEVKVDINVTVKEGGGGRITGPLVPVS